MTQNQEVFASQSLYRKALTALSRPGEVQEIDGHIIEGLSLDAQESSCGSVYLDAFAYMVFDQKISFCVLGEKSKQAAKYFRAERQAKQVQAPEADFLFVSICDSEAYQAIFNAKSGTLVDPHSSCTVFVLLEKILNSKSDKSPIKLALKGPGIKETNEVYVSESAAFKAREARADEYPCGIDMIFVDESGKFFGLPRTSKMEIFEGRA